VSSHFCRRYRGSMIRLIHTPRLSMGLYAIAAIAARVVKKRNRDSGGSM
jgi:hypothetical protein